MSEAKRKNIPERLREKSGTDKSRASSVPNLPLERPELKADRKDRAVLTDTGEGFGLSPVPGLQRVFPDAPKADEKPTPFAFELINLDTHPDSKLMRLCGEMTRLQERWDQPGAEFTSGLPEHYWGTADAIAALQPKTVDGLQMKALVALDMLSKGQRKLDKIGVKGFSMWGGCVSIVKDVIRGVSI